MGCAAGTGSGRPDDPLVQLQNQVSALRSEVNQTLRRVENDRASLSQKLEPLERSQADYLADSEEMKSRLQAIESRLNEYTERMAQLTEKIDALQTKMNEELEARQMGTIPSGPGGVGVPPAAPTSPNPVPSEATGRMPSPGGAPPPAQPPSPPPSPPSTESGAKGESGDQTAPGRLYQTAYNEYTRGNYDVAIAGFQKYLELYPNGELADFSQYWIAESFFNLKQYETALKEYDKLINLYPKSKRLPWAYYNKAQVFLKLGKQVEAASHLRYILNQFPNSEVADKAREDLAKLGG